MGPSKQNCPETGPAIEGVSLWSAALCDRIKPRLRPRPGWTAAPHHRQRTASWGWLASCLAAILLGPATAHAIGSAAPIDLNRFHPAPGNAKILTLDLADVGPHLGLVPQIFLHYSDLPLVYTLGGYPAARLVKHRVTADVSLAFSLWNRVQFSLALPVTVYEGGDVVTYPSLIDNNNPGKPLQTPPPDAVAGQEDLRFGVKGVIWRNHPESQDRTHYGIGAAGDLAVPTGNADSFLGSRLPTFNLRLLGHLTYGRFTAALNVGWLFAATEQVLTTRTGMGLTYGIGAQVEVYRYKDVPFTLLAEYYGLAHDRFDSLREAPMEIDVAAKVGWHAWNFFLGAGPGLTQGYGEPNVRVFAGATWAWQYVAPPKPPYVPPQPPPPPEVPTCEGDDCPDDTNKPVHVVVKPGKLDLSERVFFDFDKDTIKTISYPLLDEVVKVLKARPDLGRIRIEGHTDGIGGDAYNLDLSKRRAKSVVLYLLEHGIESARLSYEGYGKRCPLVLNDTPDNRARNRRVDFIILDKDQELAPPPGTCPVVRP